MNTLSLNSREITARRLLVRRETDEREREREREEMRDARKGEKQNIRYPAGTARMTEPEMPMTLMARDL